MFLLFTTALSTVHSTSHEIKSLQIIMNKKHKMVQEINLYLSLNSKLVFTVW